jgi:hypothetical protein
MAAGETLRAAEIAGAEVFDLSGVEGHHRPRLLLLVWSRIGALVLLTRMSIEIGGARIGWAAGRNLEIFVLY